jgi:hypothetical protein
MCYRLLITIFMILKSRNFRETIESVYFGNKLGENVMSRLLDNRECYIYYQYYVFFIGTLSKCNDFAVVELVFGFEA